MRYHLWEPAYTWCHTTVNDHFSNCFIIATMQLLLYYSNCVIAKLWLFMHAFQRALNDTTNLRLPACSPTIYYIHDIGNAWKNV